jgi:Helicase HerA, central domain
MVATWTATGAIGVDTGWLVDLCEAGDFVSAGELLRLGPLAGRDRLAVAPADAEALAALAWHAIERVPLADDQRPDGRFEALLSGLAATGSQVALLVSCPSGGRPTAWLGLPSAGSAGLWTTRMLAPGYLLGEPVALARTAHALLAVDAGVQRSALIRLAPARAAAGDDPHELGLLERVLDVPGDDWAIVMHARPVPGGAVAAGVHALHGAAAAAAAHLSSTIQADEARTITIADAAAERTRDWLDLLADHASEARSQGAWSVDVHLAASDPAQRAMLAGTLQGVLARPLGGDAAWQVDDVVVDPDAHRGGALLGSRDLSAFLRAPRATLGTLDVTEPLPAARRSASTDRPLELGNWLGVPDVASIGVEDLEGHAFVSGVTGSGKSTTVARLLLGLWNAHGVPFLVLDPVKADYAALAGVVRGGLRVVSARDLRLNALEAWPGFDPQTHLALVGTAFRGSFSMPSPVPYVLTRLFDALAERAGSKPAPSLHDLRAEAEALVPELGYRGEIEDNIRAALGTRLDVLTTPRRAERLAASDSRQIAELLATPTVVHLADLGDDEERAFVTTLLMLYVAEAARTRGATPGVAHVTVLEEAHRILPEPAPASASDESGDAGSVAARLLTQLLAEIRSYGEALVIVDQSPSTVARDVVRNTNLKIAHRVVDPDDREVLGGSLGLEPEANRVIGRLRVGEALITTRRLLEPQALQVRQTHFGLPAVAADGEAARSWPSTRACCGGSSRAEDHHHAEIAGADAEQTLHLLLVQGMTDASSVGVAPIVDRLAARHPRSLAPCLVAVGLRRALWRYARLEYVNEDEVGDLHSDALAQWQCNGAFGHLPDLLAKRAADMPRPLAACAECPAPCRVRPLVSGGLAARMTRTREALRREAPGREHLVLVPVAGDLRNELASTLGEAASAAAALCLIAHAAHREGLGDAVGITRLKAMSAHAKGAG